MSQKRYNEVMQLPKLTSEVKTLTLIQLAIGLIWLKSGWGKFASPEFVDNLAATLTKFASRNGLPWYKAFLESVAIPNSSLLAELTRWGELTSALLLIGGAIMIVRQIRLRLASRMTLGGTVIGAFLNAQFGLASYWTSPASETLNLVMFLIQAILGVYFFGRLKSRM